MKKIFMSLLVITGFTVSGLTTAGESNQPPAPQSVFEESITVTFAGMEEALQSATINMLEKQVQAGLEIAVPSATDLAGIAADTVATFVAR